MTINVASTPCQPVTVRKTSTTGTGSVYRSRFTWLDYMQVALWPVDESDGGIVGPEVANYTVTLCPEVEGEPPRVFKQCI
jgi:hypothetical protein